MLSRIKKIDLRKAWKHEANEFTKWLAEKENLELLAEELGIEIELEKTEAKTGNFFVDILAEEPNTGKKIIIENQLEQTNHDHLGKLITYASGYNASIIIWIVKEVREEHKQAIDWLNEHTDEDINFFAVKMELLQIGDSPFAPQFNIISEPNDWAKVFKKVTSSGNLTETKLTQLDFWQKFKEYAESNNSKLRLRKVNPQHWYDISYGSSESHICLTLNTQENTIGCEIYIDNSKELFNKFLENKEEIEKLIGAQLEWMLLEGKKASRIKLSRGADLENKNSWNDYFKWFKEKAELFQAIFGRYLR